MAHPMEVVEAAVGLRSAASVAQVATAIKTIADSKVSPRVGFGLS